jgi:hypothetical protein
MIENSDTGGETLENKDNFQSNSIPNENISSEEPDSLTLKKEIKNMEVHHHPDLHHKKKKIKEYLLEFLMIFIAVTLGFFAESYREYLAERSKEKEYIYSIVNDLKNDTLNFNFSAAANKQLIVGIDSLIKIMSVPSTNNDTGLIALKYYSRYLLSTYSVTLSDGTISQLRNNGGLRLLQKDSVYKTIISYYNMAKNLTEVQYYNTHQWMINIAQNQASHIFNYSANIIDITDPTYGELNLNTINNNRALNTTDRGVIIAFLNNVIIYRGTLGTYVNNILNLKETAIELLSLIQEEYKLKR